MELIAFASGKGGTGKTLMASCFGYSLIRAGHRVLMVDADPATDGLSLFLLGKKGMHQVRGVAEHCTFTGILNNYSRHRNIEFQPQTIHRNGLDAQGDHEISYQAVISGKGLYGDASFFSQGSVVPDLDQNMFRSAISQFFKRIRDSRLYDYVIVDTRGGFAFESTDVCALSDSFIVVSEPDVTSFYQDRNLVGRISEAARQMEAKPLLRSIIVNKATDISDKSELMNLEKVEVSFRGQLTKEFPLRFQDTHPVPVDIEALLAYKTQRIPYLAAPGSLFSFATLSAFSDILQIVTAKWTEAQVSTWNLLIQNVSKAIENKNTEVAKEAAERHKQEQELIETRKQNELFRERIAQLQREMERAERSYERELGRAQELKEYLATDRRKLEHLPVAEVSSSTTTGEFQNQDQRLPRFKSRFFRRLIQITLAVAAAIAVLLLYPRSHNEPAQDGMVQPTPSSGTNSNPVTYETPNIYRTPNGGYWERTSKGWLEHPSKGRQTAAFDEFQKDSKFIYLVDRSRVRDKNADNPMLVRIPIEGGTVQWSWTTPLSWNDLTVVVPDR